MAVIWKTLSQNVLTDAPAAQYTPALAKQGAVHTANASNPTGEAVLLNVYLVPASSDADDSTRVHRVSVPAGQTVPVLEILSMKIVAGWALFADGDGVALTLTGAEADV
jgi:hypothetical protein